MQHYRFILFSLLAVACTKPTAISCEDNFCHDPSLPYCDVDGSIGGTPFTCIAVTCEPGEAVACRGDLELRCKLTGDDIEEVECPAGCQMGRGCIDCTTSADCANPTPICNTTTNECRTCVADEECPSRVCNLDVGTCVDPGNVTYASPTGAMAGECTIDAPCDLDAALAVAKSVPSRSTVRLLDGNHHSSVGSIELQSTSLTIVGSPQTRIETQLDSAFYVYGGGVLSLRGLVVAKADFGILCENASVNTDHVRFVSSDIIYSRNCDFKLRQSTLELRSDLVMTEGSNLDADRVLFVRAPEAVADPFFGIQEGAQKVHVTNSIFDQVYIRPESSQGQTVLEFAFNTIIASEWALRCGGNSAVTGRFENNVVGSGNDSVVGMPCMGGAVAIKNNVLQKQAAPITNGSNIIMTPKFVNAANHDYHLAADSPGLNVAVPLAPLIPTVDFDGNPRPASMMDMGAFERQ